MVDSALNAAIVSLALSAVAIGWQIATYLLTGARVKVSTRYGALDGDGLLPWDRPPHDWELQQVASFGRMQPVVVAKVRNVGGGPATVEGVGVEVASGITVQQSSGLPNHDLPHRFAPWMYTSDLIVVGLIAFAASWTGGAVRRRDRPAPPPWPEAEVR